ncbi:MAG TPA: TonB-dependent receptor [Allosphingosinicella sp.]|jgi:outer membrane receptor protein involved in Fe transport
MRTTVRSYALRSAAFLGLAAGLAPNAFAHPQTDPQSDAAASQTDPQSGTAASQGATTPAPTAGGPTTQTDAATSADGQTSQGQNIVVTGSRIRSPNLTSVVPVTTISGEDFFKTGSTSIGDVLNQLPALHSTFSQANSTRFLGTSGLNLLDLRGLGTQRTLVLVNGRRHVAGDILNTAASVDTNTIPTDLIERTDIITGGDSAVYGSDALAGVVNFVLKDHFQGLQLRGQAGISQHGDAGNDFVSLLAGRNFAGGRGNIAVNFEYAHQEDFYASNRKEYSQTNGFEQINQVGTASSPQFDFVRDIRNGIYSNGGTFLTYLGGNSYTPYLFQPNGTLIQQTGTPVGLPPVPDYLGGNGDNFRDGTQFAFRPRLDRYSANIVGHFEISRALVPFIEGSYSRTDSFGSASGPFFTGAIGDTFNINNPYLKEQARGIIRDYYGAGPGDDFNFTMYKNAVDLTNRAEQARRQTYRIVAGIRGDFNKTWNYELSANYGVFDEHTNILGNINLQRYLLAIDAVDQGTASGGAANGNIVCRAKVDPASASAYNSSSYAQSTLANDIATCVPVNLFGNGNVTNAARQYLLQNSTAFGKITQFDVTGFVNGDTGGFFNFQGGPIGFVVGAEYRRETAYYKQDEATASGITFYNAIPEFKPPSFEVKEAFGEVRLPIFKDLPFAKRLTISAAARISDYKGSTGTVYSYNGGIEYSPITLLRFRANYSRAVRAPNLSDLYTPLGQNYFTFSDPCAARNLTSGSQYRAANCTAAGVPAGYDFVYKSTPGYLSGGNQNLKAEKSDSFTVGGVIAPESGILRGFALSADYYNITVNNVINSPSAQGIINACYDLPSLNNQFCGLFTRDTTTGLNSREYVENSLHVIPLNYAKLKVSGIDFDLSYQHHIRNIGDISLRGIYTLSLVSSNYLDPTNPSFEDRTLSELGTPRNNFTFNLGFKSGPVVLSYKLRYLSPMYNGTYESYNSLQGRAPTNPYQFSAQYRLYPAITYHDLRAEIDVNKDFNFYMGVDNVFNQLPPFGLTGAGGGSGIYPNVGRFLYFGVSAKY